jgi:uncharacterized membrane protein YfcA
MDLISLAVVFGAGLVAGAFGTLVGGAGLLTIPALILLGLSPQAAIGTNRFGITGINMAGWVGFHRKKMIHYKIGLILGAPAVLGSFWGADLVLKVNETLLRFFIASVTILILIFIILRPDIGVKRKNTDAGALSLTLGTLLSLLNGFYTGFYGVMSGTFVSYILIFLFGQTFLESAGTRKVATVFSSVMATMVFVVHGVVNYPMGVTLFLGSSLGSYLGANYSDRIGDVWVRRLFIGVVLAMSLKLFL